MPVSASQISVPDLPAETGSMTGGWVAVCARLPPPPSPGVLGRPFSVYHPRWGLFARLASLRTNLCWAKGPRLRSCLCIIKFRSPLSRRPVCLSGDFLRPVSASKNSVPGGWLLRGRSPGLLHCHNSKFLGQAIVLGPSPYPWLQTPTDARVAVSYREPGE